MKLKVLGLATVGAALLTGAVVATPVSAQDTQYFPALVYRTGPYAPNGVPFANGYADYLQLLNERDGGINGVKIEYQECDTAYNNDRGVECYERLKGAGKSEPTLFNPLSTGITYALIERARADGFNIVSSGYGRADASDGRVFSHVFTLPITYWAGADALVQHVKGLANGNLKGKKIALVYHDSAYGKEPIATLERLAGEEGYEFSKFPVAHPGLEQKATWLQIGRQLRPDWVFMWGWGVMNSTAIKEAAAVGFPMENFYGIWWSATEADVIPAGDLAKGYKALGFHGVGAGFPVHADIKKHLYDKGKGAGQENLGEVLYNRGIFNGVVASEAVRLAQTKFGKRTLTAKEVNWGMNNLHITPERWAELGMPDFAREIKITCADHEGGGSAYVQQWDGKSWSKISDWIAPNNAALRPAYEASAAQYAKENNIAARECN
jgi:branched-chain amino acid transport system substrate-binding protein